MGNRRGGREKLRAQSSKLKVKREKRGEEILDFEF
jgi:hypothetical protein